MFLLNPLDALVPKIPFSFFAKLWVRVTSGALGAVSVGVWGCRQLSPPRGVCRPPPPKLKARPPQPNRANPFCKSNRTANFGSHCLFVPMVYHLCRYDIVYIAKEAERDLNIPFAEITHLRPNTPIYTCTRHDSLGSVFNHLMKFGVWTTPRHSVDWEEACAPVLNHLARASAQYCKSQCVAVWQT